MKKKVSKNSVSGSKTNSTESTSPKTSKVTPKTNSTESTSLKTNKVTPKTTYIPVSKNIYNTGTSYRVRVSVNGETVSINTPSKKEAYRVRKQLLEMRTTS